MKLLLNSRATAILALALLAGCSSTKSLYGWNDYQPEVYSYFQGESVEKQIQTLEKNLTEFKAKDQLAPPGFHAHLGMLYAQVGNMDLAAQQFNTEKNLFPESAPYMNFLLNKKDLPKTAATAVQTQGNAKLTKLNKLDADATPVKSNSSRKDK